MDTDFPQTLPGDVMVRILTVITFLAGGPAGPKRLRTEWNIKSPASAGTKLMCPSSLPPAVRAGDKGQPLLSVPHSAGNVLIRHFT